MVDLHRHDEFSRFDGFGKTEELAALAKSYGYTSLGISNHGCSNSLVQHNISCKNHGIKAILGIEGYFLPKYVPSTKGYHLCLFAKNLDGYKNLNSLQYYGDLQKYYNPIWDFSLLKKYSKGLVCTSACVGGLLSQYIIKDKIHLAKKAVKHFVDIFGDDFYIEIQPYSIDEDNLQETVNVKLIGLAKEFNVKVIMTSDSHYGAQEDFTTYLKLHEIAKHDLIKIEQTYKERYMPKLNDLKERFLKMHSSDFSKHKAEKMADLFIANLEELETKVEEDFLSKLEVELPELVQSKGVDTHKLFVQKIKQGLKRIGKFSDKKYVNRAKEEMNVIHEHGFEDYFLIVADYTNWAKRQGIAVGPGRGSVCNCLIAYLLGITEVDSIYFNLDFRRFLRLDKKKIPDIDLDFETNRRHEVIHYLLEKYKGHAAQICSYGLYKVDNLINDLASVSGLPTVASSLDEDGNKLSPEELANNKRIVANIKSLIKNHVANELGDIDCITLLKSAEAKQYNKDYDNIIVHFTKLYKKVRFLGTHAAGVAITKGSLFKYTACFTDKKGNMFTSYDLIDCEKINLIKFDVLGLKTMESISQLRSLTNEIVDYKTVVNDKKLIQQFTEAEVDGVFQYEKNTARSLLLKINADCFDDVVAASAMNRPGPLSLKTPDLYAQNKFNIDEISKNACWEYTKETYGTIIYQEQIMLICVFIGDMDWGTADKILKMMKSTSQKAEQLAEQEKMQEALLNEFLKGAKRHKMNKEEATDMFIKMIDAYSFNKGHAVGYALISMEEMFYKYYHPSAYWYAKARYSKDEQTQNKFLQLAAKNGVVIFLPHVNSTSNFSLKTFDGEQVIQMGLISINGIGEKAADFIESERLLNGDYKSYDDFIDRCKNRAVTSKVIKLLKENGALEFNQKLYFKRVKAYYTALYSRNFT